MKKLIVVALCVTILLFIYYFVFKEFPRPLVIDGSGTSQSPFRGKLHHSPSSSLTTFSAIRSSSSRASALSVSSS